MARLPSFLLLQLSDLVVMCVCVYVLVYGNEKGIFSYIKLSGR